MMPQVDACIGTELLGLAHTDNGRRDCRRGWEADEPVLRRSRRRVKRPRQVSFRIYLHDVRTGSLLHGSTAQPMRSPLGGCVSGVPLLLCGAPISVCGSPSWEVEECPPATMLLVNVSAYEEAHHQSGVSPPLLGLETLEINGWMGLVACTPYMCVHATAVGFRSRSLGGASGFPPPGSVGTACQDGADDLVVVWPRSPSRGYSVPCRLLHETPAQAQGRRGWPGGWPVLAILPSSVPT